jgi:hypothetical protein
MNEQQPQIDPEHPWVIASQYGNPAPVPTSVALEPITLEQDGKELDAAMLTIIDPTGVKNAIIPPNALHQLVMQGAQILDLLKQKQQSGLVVADKSVMDKVISQEQAMDLFRRK